MKSREILTTAAPLIPERYTLQELKQAAAGCVAVGMPVARHPPHRSLRADLPHRAPASGSDAQAVFRVRVIDSR